MDAWLYEWRKVTVVFVIFLIFLSCYGRWHVSWLLYWHDYIIKTCKLSTHTIQKKGNTKAWTNMLQIHILKYTHKNTATNLMLARISLKYTATGMLVKHRTVKQSAFYMDDYCNNHSVTEWEKDELNSHHIEKKKNKTFSVVLVCSNEPTSQPLIRFNIFFSCCFLFFFIVTRCLILFVV